MRRNGFTLVEALVAIAIFALISTSAVAMLSFTLDSRAQIESRIARLAAFERARALMAADLTQAANRPTRDPQGLVGPAFFAASGDEGGVSLTRRGWENPDLRNRASLQYVEYALREGRLERRARPLLDGAALQSPDVLLTGVSNLKVYVRQAGPWQEAQGGYRGEPPAAVRIEFDLEGFGRASQSFLIAGPP